MFQLYSVIINYKKRNINSHNQLLSKIRILNNVILLKLNNFGSKQGIQTMPFLILLHNS